MKNNCVALLVVLSIFSSCKKGGDGISNSGTGGSGGTVDQLTSFSVSVIERKYNSAIIQWDESKSTNTKDTVKYKVFLNNVLVDSPLTKLQDTLKNVFIANNYLGTVTAYTSSGLSKTASFTLESLSGQAFVSSGNILSCNNIFTNGVVTPLIWQKTTNGFNGAMPTVSHDSIFFSSGFGSSGIISSLNAANGNTYWSISPGYSLLGGTSLTYYQGNLYAATDSGVVSLKANTGTMIWKYLRPNPSSTNLLMTNPVIDNNKVFVSTKGNSGVIMAINIATGIPVWEFPLGGQLSATPVTINNLLIFNAGNTVYALDHNSGTMVWSQNNLGRFDMSPIIADNKIIVCNSSGYISALNPTTGTIVWSKFYDGPEGFSAIATGNGICFFTTTVQIGSGSYQAKLNAINTSNGQFLWEQLTLFEGIANIIYANNSVYVGGNGLYGNLWRFNALSGNFEGGGGIAQPQRFSLIVNNKAYYNPEHGNYK